MSDNYPSGYNEAPSLDDLLQPYEIRIKALEDFIKKARDEAYADNHFGNLVYVVPEWFMTDDIV